MKVSEAQLVASLCRKSFFSFFTEFWSTVVPERFEYNWHIEYLCHVAQKAAERIFRGEPKAHDLVVNVPPGTSKSSIFSILLPAWMWTRMPTARFIGGSYSFPLAMDLSRKCRDVVLSDKYQQCFPEIKLRDDQNAKHHFANTHGGYRYAVGVNGAVTGMHGHIVAVDDPLDPQSALSQAEIDAANHWLTEVLSSRKVDKAITPTFLIMQRIAVEDPTHTFLERGNCKHVCLPAELTDDVKPTGLRRYYRKRLLDPKRLSQSVLDEFRKNGDFYFSGQFLQRPVPPGGGMFKVKRLKYVDRPPATSEFKIIVRDWDKAGTLDDGAYTAGVKLGVTKDNRVFVLDVRRARLESYEREELIKSTAEDDGRKVLIGVEQEPGSGGKESAEATVRRLLGFKVKIHKPNKADGNKAARADPFAYQVNGGNVYLVRGHWNKDYVRELMHFPMSKFADQVDASSGAFSLAARGRRRVGGMKSKSSSR